MLLTCLTLAWLGVSFTDLPVLFSGQQPGLLFFSNSLVLISCLCSGNYALKPLQENPEF